MGTKNHRAVYEWVNISDDLVYEWDRFFKGKVYDWGRFRNTGSNTRTTFTHKLHPPPPTPPSLPPPPPPNRGFSCLDSHVFVYLHAD